MVASCTILGHDEQVVKAPRDYRCHVMIVYQANRQLSNGSQAG